MVNKLKTCRCCLAESKFENELYEFSSEVSIDDEPSRDPQNFVKISDCFTLLVNIEVPVEAEDFSKICSQCLGDLKFCYMFQRKCLDSEKMYNSPGKESKFSAHHFAPESNEDQQSSNMIEYVEEEYIDDMNDEDTNDGFEHVDIAVKDEPETFDALSQSLETNEQEESTSATSGRGSKGFYKRHYRHANLKHDEESDDEKPPNGSQLQLHQCNFCGKISVSKKEHEIHQTEHDGEATFKCKKCDAKFMSKNDARDHLTSAHSNDDKIYNCETCTKGFKNRYQLILHQRSHTGEKPFECAICHRCFSMSSNLQKHLDTHSTEKPYMCTVCNQFFKTQRSLKFHTVCYHQPEAKVKCPSCDKSFVNKSYLKMHMLYHTGEKNYTCTICNSKYYKSSHLKRHIQNVHFKLRLMKCEYCASDFVRKETYRAHIISHHKRHLSDQEYEDVLDRIKKFQPPALDINEFTLEKQKNPQVVVAEVDESEMEVIEEDSQQEDDGMAIEAEGDYYEESEIYEDEQ